MIRKFGLIGYPLGHSFSKKYFSEKFRKEGISDAQYDNYPIEQIEEFPHLRKAHPELQGLNVTIPYKESVIPFLDVLSEGAREIGAVNTICFCTKTGHLARVGHNTDAIGFRQSLEPHLDRVPQKALVLGTGGASKAVIHVLEQMGTEIIMVSSSGKKDAVSYEKVNKGMITSSELIVNTTPLGMHPKTEDCPDIPYEHITNRHLLYDLVYNPAVTEFMRRGVQKGARTLNGYKMLELQAEAAWEIWNRK